MSARRERVSRARASSHERAERRRRRVFGRVEVHAARALRERGRGEGNALDDARRDGGELEATSVALRFGPARWARG